MEGGKGQRKPRGRRRSGGTDILVHSRLSLSRLVSKQITEAERTRAHSHNRPQLPALGLTCPLQLPASLEDLVPHALVVVRDLACDHPTEDATLGKTSDGRLRGGADLSTETARRQHVHASERARRRSDTHRHEVLNRETGSVKGDDAY